MTKEKYQPPQTEFSFFIKKGNQEYSAYDPLEISNMLSDDPDIVCEVIYEMWRWRQYDKLFQIGLYMRVQEQRGYSAGVPVNVYEAYRQHIPRVARTLRTEVFRSRHSLSEYLTQSATPFLLGYEDEEIREDIPAIVACYSEEIAQVVEEEYWRDLSELN